MCPEQQHGNTLLEVLNSNTLVTSLNQLMGATVGYCVLLSAYICLLLNPTPQKIVAITVSYTHYVVSLDAVGGVYVV
jgi:hypothetical protein